MLNSRLNTYTDTHTQTQKHTDTHIQLMHASKFESRLLFSELPVVLAWKLPYKSISIVKNYLKFAFYHLVLKPLMPTYVCFQHLVENQVASSQKEKQISFPMKQMISTEFKRWKASCSLTYAQVGGQLGHAHLLQTHLLETQTGTTIPSIWMFTSLHGHIPCVPPQPLCMRHTYFLIH